MTDPKFSPGDVVRLRTSGVLMAVENDACHLGVHVVWFDDSAHVHRTKFSQDLLILDRAKPKDTITVDPK